MGLCPATCCGSRDLRWHGEKGAATSASRPSPDPSGCQAAEPPSLAGPAQPRGCSLANVTGTEAAPTGSSPVGHRTFRVNEPEFQDGRSGAKPRGAESTVHEDSGRRQQSEDSDNARGRASERLCNQPRAGACGGLRQGSSHQDGKPRGQRQAHPSAAFPGVLTQLPAPGTVWPGALSTEKDMAGLGGF